MSFHKTNHKINVAIQIGDRVRTTIKHESLSRYFEVGSTVTVIGITDSGYNIQDNEGNRILKIGWITDLKVFYHFDDIILNKKLQKCI